MTVLRLKLKKLLKITGVGKEKTIPILQEIQKRKGYIPEDLLDKVSEIAGIPESQFLRSCYLLLTVQIYSFREISYQSM